MNAIRIRKENQVYSAEEKRALALINHEEKAAKVRFAIGPFAPFNKRFFESSFHVTLCFF